ILLGLFEVSAGNGRSGGKPDPHEDIRTAVVESFVEFQRPTYQQLHPREFGHGLYGIQIEDDPVCPAGRRPEDIRDVFYAAGLDILFEIIKGALDGVFESPKGKG